MGAIFIDMTGQRFGRLTVLEFVGLEPKHKNRLWKCLCDCGTIKEITRATLTSGHAKSCGCLELENRIYHQKRNFVDENNKSLNALPPGESSFNRIYYWYLKGAKLRGLCFEITKDKFRELTKLNCYYCNLPPTKSNKYGNGTYTYTGLDRLNNSLGYTIDNVVPCCEECNYIKGARDSDVFIAWLKRAGEFTLNNH